MKTLLIALASVSYAYGQGCAGYTKQYLITIPAGSVTDTLTNYTLLVSGTYPYLAVSGGGFAKNTHGYDIIFTQAGHLLKWNMPIYISGTGQMKANVLVPSISSTVNTYITLCVGNASVLSMQGGRNAYDSYTKMALQFPSASLTTDSSAVQTVVNTGSVTHTATGPTYLVDAAAMSGSNYLDLGMATGFPTGSSSRSFTFWLDPSSTSANALYISYGSPGARDEGWSIGAQPSVPNVYLETDTINGNSGPVAINQWHRWDVTYAGAGSTLNWYLDGVPSGVITPVNTPNTVLAQAYVGRFTQFNGWNLVGQMAEVRVAATNRSAAWIGAEYRNQTNPAAFYSISVPPRAPVTSAVTITANSPLSVRATWTTDIASDSQVSCGLTSGGPYIYASSVVNPNPTWNVTSHTMASNPMPNGPYYCIVTSTSPALGTVNSAETFVVLPAMPTTIPMAMSPRSVKPVTKLGDRYTGANGAPQTGAWAWQDSGTFCWADDGDEYHFLPGWGANGSTSFGATFDGHDATMGMVFVKFSDALHTSGTLLGTAWQNGANNSIFQTGPVGHRQWFVGSCLSVNGSMYNWVFNNALDKGGLVRSTDYYQSTLSAEHAAVGPDVSYITTMSCSGGTVTATSKLNVTAQLANILAPGAMAIVVAGANGNNVNGVHGPVIANTPTTISWTQSCTQWSWTGSGGTGGGGGTINIYGADVPTTDSIVVGRWLQNDAAGYLNGTKWAGMDGFAYSYVAAYDGIRLARIRVEDLLTQDPDKMGFYVGKQVADDGIYNSNWDISATKFDHAILLNPKQWTALAVNGRGANGIEAMYVTAFNRYVIAYQVALNPDSNSGGTLIFDGGQYPWSQITAIGDARRNTDVYYMGGPEYPQFVAKSQTSANGVTSIHLSHNGGNFGQIYGDPSRNEYDLYMTPNVQFVAKSAAPAANPMLAPGELASGMELAYNFDVLTGSLSMPNVAPADAGQQWAWQAADSAHPLMIDDYGAWNFSQPTTSTAGGFFPTDKIKQDVALATPYAQALSGSLTVIDCFGHYPTTLLQVPSANAIALKKGTDLIITWAGGNNWAVSFLGTAVGNVTIPDNSVGCVVIRRDSSNRVSLYNSAGIGSFLPLTPAAVATASGAWSSNAVVIGDATNSFWGIESLLRIWSRDLSDGELISELSAIRGVLRIRGNGSVIP